VSDADVEVVRDQFAAVNERDFPRAMDGYAEDVVLIIKEVARVPNPGVYEGKAAVGEWFGDWFRAFGDDYRFDIKEARELGDGVIFLFAAHRGKGRASGVEVRQENGYLYRVKGGKVVRVQLFADAAGALEAASLPEWSGAETD
jgi:Ketosteroid isomerase-related protein